MEYFQWAVIVFMILVMLSMGRQIRDLWKRVRWLQHLEERRKNDEGG